MRSTTRPVETNVECLLGLKMGAYEFIIIIIIILDSAWDFRQ